MDKTKKSIEKRIANKKKAMGFLKGVREVSIIFVCAVVVLLIFSMLNENVLDKLLTTENFRNLIGFFLFLVLAKRTLYGEKIEESYWRLIFMLISFYFGVAMSDGE